MKKSVLLAAAFAFAAGANAQMPDGSIAPDFTANDINGVSHHLYEYLDQGYTVVLDISAAWCGPCWSYHTGGALENLYDTYGPGTAEDKVMVFMIEGQSTNTTAQLYGPQALTGQYATQTQGDWVTGTPYPIIDNAAIANDYQISYYPTIYTICPNRVLHESSQISTAAHWTDIQTCPEAATGINAAVLSYDGETIACGALDMPVTIQNMGTSTLTSCTIAVKEGASTLASFPWTGSLPTYNTASHTFPAVAITNPAIVTVEITSSDAVAGDNTLDPGLVPAEPSTQNMYFNLLLDYYCSETTWELKNAGGVVVQSGGPYNCAGAGGGADANTLKQYSWTVPAMGCYQMFLYDSYGDGLLSMAYTPPHPDGSWELKDGAYNLLWSGAANFGDETKGGIEVNAAAGIGEVAANGGVSVYPNPNTGSVYVQVELDNASSFSVRVVDVLGKVVMGYDRTMGSGTNLFPMDMSALENGVYYFNITVNGKTEIRKVTLNK